jgi:hypothetical protein
MTKQTLQLQSIAWVWTKIQLYTKYQPRKVARLEKRELDEKQYNAYEMIACTFLLSLVHDGNDPNITLYSCLRHKMGSTTTLNINNIVHRLVARGEQSQGKVN